MKTLNKADLESFRQAILKDYGIEIKGRELYETTFNLLKFFESLIQFDKEKDGFENHPGQPIENTKEDKDNE